MFGIGMKSYLKLELELENYSSRSQSGFAFRIRISIIHRIEFRKSSQMIFHFELGLKSHLEF